MSILSQQKQSVNTDFPNLRPSLDLRFALAKKLDPRITFTRGSTGTYFGPDGIMRTAGVNEPRFDHDPITGQSLGLLIEESRTNLYTRSDIEGTVGTQPTNMFFAGGASVGQTAVVSTDVSLGPNGQSAKHIRGTPSDNNVGYLSGVTVVAGSTYTFSTYVYIPSSQAKNFSGKFIAFYMENAYTSRTTASADVSIVDRWQRVTGTCVPSGTTATWVARTNAVAGSFFYTDCWQLELGAFPTSYMPASGGSQFTRSADNASMTGTNFSSWYNQGEGSIYSTFINNTSSNTDGSGSGRGVAAFSNGTTTERIRFGTTALGSSISVVYISSNITQSSLSTQNYTVGSKISIISSYKSNYFTLARNNFTSIQSSIKGSTPTISQLEIGRSTLGSGVLNGTISRLTYYPIQITNQQLINLSS